MKLSICDEQKTSESTKEPRPGKTRYGFFPSRTFNFYNCDLRITLTSCIFKFTGTLVTPFNVSWYSLFIKLLLYAVYSRYTPS